MGGHARSSARGEAMSEPAKDIETLIQWNINCVEALRRSGHEAGAQAHTETAAMLDALRTENALLREALQHAASAMDSLVSDEMPYTQSCMIWRIATGCIREALDPDGQKERRAKALSDLAEMDADLLDIDPKAKP